MLDKVVLNIYNSFVMSRCIMIIDVSKLFAADGNSVVIDKEFNINSESFSDFDISINTPVTASGDIKSIRSI